MHEFRIAAPFGRHQAGLGQLALHPLKIGIRFVDFIDGHDDRHFGGFGVIDGFLGLRHYTIVSGDHQHDDVGDFCAA